MIKFIAYYRVSTKGQGRSGLGLEAQRHAVHSFIGSEPMMEFIEVESGKRNDRPQLQAALIRAELTGARLVIAKLDRLGRNAAFLMTLKDSGVDFVCVDQPHANRLTIGILALVAQDEAERISERTKAALAAAKARGTKLGGDRGNLRGEAGVKGRAKASANRAAVAQDRAAKIRPLIDEAKATGLTSVRQIASFLNDRGILTARGNQWQPGSVQRLLAA